MRVDSVVRPWCVPWSPRMRPPSRPGEAVTNAADEHRSERP
ncbi:hypothetical protein KPATCC21470_2945 [Kitasatospora purpeofusca]